MYVQFNVFAKYTGGTRLYLYCGHSGVRRILLKGGGVVPGQETDKSGSSSNEQKLFTAFSSIFYWIVDHRGDKKCYIRMADLQVGEAVLFWEIPPVNHSMIALKKATRSQILIGRQIVDEIYVNQFQAKFDLDQWSTW